MANELEQAAEIVRQMTKASEVTWGTIELAIWILGYRRVADTMPLPRPIPQPIITEEPSKSDLAVDATFKRLASS